MTSTLGIKKIQYPNGTNSITIDSSGSAAITTANITTAAITTANVTNATATGTITTPSINGGQVGGRRNMIINGAMQVAQRSTSVTGLGADGGTYNTCDRWNTNFLNTAGRLTMSQVSDVHDGFSKALKLDCTTADTSIAAGELFQLMYRFEGQDLQRLKKGSSDAESVTISFYVKGNANATYALELYDSRRGRHASQLFNVTSSWNRISLTFTGDTSDAFDDDNALSMSMSIWLHAGSNYSSGTINGSWAAADNTRRAAGITSFFDSTDRTFFLTGVQMELGSQATAFEHRSFGEELALCQRYYQRKSNGYLAGNGSGSNQISFGVSLPTSLRATPSTPPNFSMHRSGNVSATVSINQVTFSADADNTLLQLRAAGISASDEVAYNVHINGILELNSEL